MGINCERVIRLSDFQPFEPYLISSENFYQPVKLKTVFFQNLNCEFNRPTQC